MAKATTIKEALHQWEEKNGKPCINAEEISLQFRYPPIEKMDSTLNQLVNCRKLSLSTNLIEKISGISALKNLKILSLARNNIKNITGIEALAETLEELWVSYNLIEKIKPIEAMKALKVLYISNNSIKEWVEFQRMAVPPLLVEIQFIGNPLHETMDEASFRAEAIKKLQNLKKLDGEPVIRGE